MAVPLGAIGMMLLSEGVRLGFVAAWPAALGVAAADVIYAVIAVVFGGVVAPVVIALAPWPAIASGVILLILAARGMIGIRTINDTATKSPHVGRRDAGSRCFSL